MKDCEDTSRAVEMSGLDHVVLTVRDMGATCGFYERVLGMRTETFGEGRTALHFGDQKINLHAVENDFGPDRVAKRPTTGSGDLCFLTDVALERVTAHLEACGVEIVKGPVIRTGARGPIRSVYVRDPDGNLIEIAHPIEAAHR